METVTVTIIDKKISNTFLSFLYHKTDNVEDRYADLYYKWKYIWYWNNECITYKRDNSVPREIIYNSCILFVSYIRELEHELMIKQWYFYINF